MFEQPSDPAEQARERFSNLHRGLMYALARAGHAPEVHSRRRLFRRRNYKLWLQCETCGHRRRRGIPNRFQQLSSRKPCPGVRI